MTDEREGKQVPDEYAAQYWAWVEDELDRWDDDREFGPVESDPMTEG